MRVETVAGIAVSLGVPRWGSEGGGDQWCLVFFWLLLLLYFGSATVEAKGEEAAARYKKVELELGQVQNGGVFQD